MLNATQAVWFRLDSRARYRTWSKVESNTAHIVETGVTELEARIHAWSAAAEQDNGTFVSEAREVYLNWAAKRIVGLAEELEVRRNGLEAYTNEPRDHHLPAQHLSVQQQVSEGSEYERGEDEDEDDLFDAKYI